MASTVNLKYYVVEDDDGNQVFKTSYYDNLLVYYKCLPKVLKDTVWVSEYVNGRVYDLDMSKK